MPSASRHSLALLSIALLACGGEQRAPAHTGTPSRVITLGPAATEIAFILGAGDRLVGRSRWDHQPPGVDQLPEVGDAIRPSVERLIAMRPDLVVLYPAADNAGAMAALDEAGIAVLPLRIDRIADFLHAVDTLGAILDARTRADSIRRALSAALDEVRARPRPQPPPSVFIPVWHDPLMTVGAGSFLSELVEIAGGANAYGDRAEPSFTVSFEDVVRRDPAVVLASPASASRLAASAQWRALRAIREGRIVAIDTTLMSQPSTRLGEAARVLADRLREVPR